VPAIVAALLLLAGTGGAAVYLLPWPGSSTGSGGPHPWNAPSYTTEDAVALVRGHYAALPDDPYTAYQNLATHYRPTYEDYTANWGRYDQVHADGISAEQDQPTRFVVRVRVTFVVAGAETGGWYELVVEYRQERLLIVQSSEV
jgi:hypothetical protein